MLDIKYIRENAEPLKKAIKNKKIKLDLDERRTEHRVTCGDPESGLRIQCVATEYHGDGAEGIIHPAGTAFVA